jgi:hypothetical protein
MSAVCPREVDDGCLQRQLPKGVGKNPIPLGGCVLIDGV